MKITARNVAACVTVLFSLSAISVSIAAGYVQTNLVSDQAGAVITDASLVNPWGISHSATSPFWVSNNGTGVVTLYTVVAATNVPTKQALMVTIPGAGSVTGQVFVSAAGSFNGDLFVFASEDGTISGWRGALGTTAEVLLVGSPGSDYKGIAEGMAGGNPYIYAANFKYGSIDVTPGTGAPALSGNFTDPNLPAGYAPFNIQNLGGQIYVTYAVQAPGGHADVPGAGHGIVNRFDTSGNLIGRLVSNGVLNSPWGLAIAPANFGQFSNALLVGNFGDGRINAFSVANGAFLGTLSNAGGTPIVVSGLWGLLFGNGGNGGATNLLYFTAGTGGEAHGLFGSFAALAVTPPALVGAASRHVHGTAGTFDLPL